MGRRYLFMLLVLELENPVARSARVRTNAEKASRMSKTYACDGGNSFSLKMVEDPALKSWFTEILSNTEGERLGAGRDADSSMGYYNSLKFAGAWSVYSDKDGARFSRSQTRQMLQRRLENRRKGLKMLSARMQKLTSYPQSLLDSSTQDGTYLLHGTNPEALRPIMCNGLREEKDGLVGAAVYLYDLAAKADQYCGRDCARNADGTCTYLMDTLKSTRKPGFPINDKFRQIDRNRPMHYMFVVLAAPFRIARNYIAKNVTKKGRQSWNFWMQPSSAGVERASWIKYDYDWKSDNFIDPGSGAAWQRDYELAQILAKSPHPQETGWFLNDPSLAASNGRYDEYVVPEAQYTKLGFLVAYQRFCSGSRCSRQNEALIPAMPREPDSKRPSHKAVRVHDPRQRGEVDVLGFYHPGHPTTVDELSEVPYLGNFWKLPKAFEFGPPGQAPITFTNAEAAFHACKFWKSGQHVKFANQDAGKAFRLKKEAGRILAQEGKSEDFTFGGFGSNWKAMRAILRIKFDPKINSRLASKLIATGDAFLLEHDETVRKASVWGSNKDGSGTNWLGAMLMLIRDELTSQDARSPSSWSSFIAVSLDGRTGPKQPEWRKMVKRASRAINRATDAIEIEKAASRPAHTQRQRPAILKPRYTRYGRRTL